MADALRATFTQTRGSPLPCHPRSVLLFACAVSILSALLFGLLPVLRYARPQLSVALRSESRGSSGSHEHLRVRGALVVVQVAMALALLVSAGLMIRTFRELGSVDPGFTRPDAIQTLRVTFPPSSQPDPELLPDAPCGGRRVVLPET